MAKLILKSIAYYPQALAELPMSHKDLGLIDTDKPYKKLIIPTQKQHLYRLVDMQTGQVLKAQKLIRDHNDLKVYVGDVIVVELKDFFSFNNVAMVKAEQEPLYLVDAGEVTCISGLISPADGAQLPEMYVLWEPGLPVQTCLNPNAMGLVPVAGLAGISGLTTGGVIGISSAVGVSIVQSNLTYGTPPVVLPKLIGAVFAGPVIGQTVGNIKVSGLKVQAFDANGNSLGITDVKADGSYELELTNATYKGALVLKVFDPAGNSVTAKYMDEATIKAKAFTTMMASINYQGDATKPVTVNITALTNLAAAKAGAKATDSGVSVPSADAIDSANTQVAKKFLGNSSLADSPVIPTVNADGSSNLSKANTYGIALALLSQIESVSSKTTAQVADLLSPALTSPDTNKAAISYVNQASANMINSGVDALKIQNMVKALGNNLATGSVSLNSNAGSNVNVTTTAPDENSKLTATVSNFVDANNTNNANKAFSNPSTYQWQASTDDGLTWTNIIGDNAKTVDFTLTQAQVGQKVRVLVKNTDETGFDEYLASAATKAVKNVNQDPSGSISIGVNNGDTLQQNNILGITSNTLTDTDGLGSLSYQWQSRTSGGSFVDISGATFNTYTLTQAEVGKEIRLKASYTDGQGTAEAVFSVQTASVANVNDPPQGNVLINGANTPNQSFNQNQIVTATNNLSDPDNNGAAISGLTYQWQSSSNGSAWADISGATNSTYTLTQAEVGKYVQVLAKYADATGVSESKASESTARIVDVNDAPTGSLTINGTASEKQTLTATHTLTDADNNGAAISGMTYQWEQADSATGPWQAIASANGTAFTPGNEQVGKFLRVSVSYTDAAGYNNSQSSTATAAIVNVNDAPGGAVTVTGSMAQGTVLQAANTLSDADGMGAVVYKWQRSTDGSTWTDIAGASTDSYTLTQADVGKYVHVRATYTDLHGTTETVDSATGTSVANVNDAPIGSVSVTGNMTQGSVLQVANTLSDLDGMGTVSYQWQVSGNNRDWTDIATATNSSFTLTQAQTGQYVRVKASYTDLQGTVETVYNDTSSNTTVLDVMEAPVLTLTTANKTFTEASGAAQQANAVSGLFTSVNLSDAENNNIASITLSVSGLQDGANENLVVAGSNLSLVTAAAGTVLNGSLTYSSSVRGVVATVTLTKSGGWTLEEAKALIAGIGYQNTNTDNPTPGDRSISLLQLVDNGSISNANDKNTVDFSAANSNAISATVTVQGVNDAPVLSGSNNPAYTENGTAFKVNPNINISDVDSTKLVSAKVSITSGYVSGDTLSLPAGLTGIGDISASAFDTGTRTLTLTSTLGATQAEWQTALRAVQFSSNSDTPGTSRSIGFVVNDGFLDSPTVTTTVSVTEVNDIPVLSNASTTLAYTENANSIINASITLSDADNAVPVKVTVAFTGNSFVSAEDQLLFTSSASTGNIAAAWDSAAGTLTLTSLNNTATLSQWNAAMQAVSYKNLSDAPSTGNRSISFTANDGTDDSVAAITTVSVTAVNDAPVLAAASKTAGYTEPTGTVTGASPVAVFGSSSLTLTDFENNSIKAFSLTVTGVVDSTEVLNIDGTDIALIPATTATTSGNLFTYSVTSSGTNFTVTFSKSSNYVDISTVKSLLEAMTYNNTNANNPTAGARVITVASVQDSGGGTDTYTTSLGNAAKSTVTVTATNDAPTLTSVSKTAAYTEPAGTGGASPVIVFGSGSLTLTDAESNTIKAFSLTVTGVSDSTEVLNIDGVDISLIDGRTSTTSGNGFTYSVSSTGSQTFTVSFSKSSNFVDIGTVKSLLEAMTYNNTSANNPTAGDRVITVASVQDSGGGTDTYLSGAGSVAQSTVTVTAANDAPVNTLPGSTVSVGYNSSTFITGLGVSDADAGAATNFSVKLAVNQGTLTLGSSTGVTVTNNGTNSVTLTGKVADINSLLVTSNAVKYTAPSNLGGSYTLTMTSNDTGNSGTGAGVDVVNTVSIAVNQPPVLGGAATVATYTENGTAVAIFNTITVTDADNPKLASAKVTIANFVTGEDVLGFTNIAGSMGNITGSYNSGSGVMSLTSSGGTATLTEWQAALRAVTYSNSSENPNTTQRTISYVVNDGAADSLAVSNSLNVAAVNDAPTVSAPATFTVNEDTLLNLLYTGTPFADVDNTSLTVTLSIADGTIGATSGGGVTVGGTAIARTFSGTVAALNTFFTTSGNITYTGALNVNGSRTLTTSVSDGYLSNVTPSNTNINITAVNDAPVASGLASLTAVLEDTAAPAGALVSALFSGNFSDVDTGNTLVGVAITANLATATQGKWQWQVSGGAWTDIATSGLADASALYLAANITLRFLPVANYNGTPGALTARLVDSSAIGLTNGAPTNVSNNGVITPYSSGTVSLNTSITAVNDPPALTLTSTNKTFTEGTGSTQGADVTGIFTSATVTDIENDYITGMTLTVSNVLDGSNEVLLFNSTPTRTIPLATDIPTTITLGNGPTNWGYTQSWNSSTKVSTIFLTKQLGNGVDLATAKTLVESFGYRNTNIDNPTPGTRVVSLTQIIDAGSGTSPNVNTSNFSTLQANIVVSSVNDAPTFSSNIAPSSLTTTKSQSPSRALNIPLSGFQVSDADGGNTIETISFGLGDITPPASANSANPMAPLNINFPNKPNSLYLSKTSDNTYSVAGTVSDLNEWLRLSNAITYNPRTSFSGTITSPIGFRITDSLGGFGTSNTFTIGVTADTIAPVFSKAVFSREANNKIILSYDEPLNTTNIPATGAFTVSGTSVSSLAVVGTNIVLTTATNVASGTTVTYTKPASDTAAIQDVAGNQSATTSTVTIATDTSAPVLNSSPAFNNGNAGSNVFILNFNEELASASNSVPAGFNVSGFSVSVVDSVNPSRSGGASTNWYQSGGSSSFSEKAFAISFNFGFLSQSASIQVKYVDPGAGNLNALKDLAGNHATNMVLGAWTNDTLSAVDTNFIAGKSVQVVGGMGNDTMTGGLANDTFTWFAGDAGTAGAVDIVKGFVPLAGTTGDKLDISKLLTNGYNSGSSTLSQWVTSVTTAQTSPGGVANSTRIVIDPDSTTGSGTATQTIWLEGVNLTLVSGTLDTQLNALKTNGVLIA